MSLSIEDIRRANDRTMRELSGLTPAERHEYILNKIKNTPHGMAICSGIAEYYRKRYPGYDSVFAKLFDDIKQR